jgi:hypothetical protein
MSHGLRDYLYGGKFTKKTLWSVSDRPPAEMIVGRSSFIAGKGLARVEAIVTTDGRHLTAEGTPVPLEQIAQFTARLRNGESITAAPQPPATDSRGQERRSAQKKTRLPLTLAHGKGIWWR